jgi:hypothetical protein
MFQSSGSLVKDVRLCLAFVWCCQTAVVIVNIKTPRFAMNDCSKQEFNLSWLPHAHQQSKATRNSHFRPESLPKH